MPDPLLMVHRSLRELERLPTRVDAARLPDPRAQLLVTLGFCVVIATFDPRQPAALLPLLLFPVWQLRRARLPAKALLSRLAMLAPFALIYAAANPLYDDTPVPVWGVEVRAGWLSGLSILIRFALTVSAALLLLCTRRFDQICGALGALGVPRALTTQLSLLYRYLHVLLDEALRLTRARRLRAPKLPLKLQARLLAGLLERTLDRGARIYQAMRLRGWSGPPPLELGPWRARDALFMAGWGLYFIGARWAS